MAVFALDTVVNGLAAMDEESDAVVDILHEAFQHKAGKQSFTRQYEVHAVVFLNKLRGKQSKLTTVTTFFLAARCVMLLFTK